MPWLPIYSTSQDLSVVLEWLNPDPEVGFIAANGPGVWIAEETLSELSEARYCVWHIPDKPLPLLPPDYRHRPTVAPDPRHGWKELQAGKNRSVPYFGPGHPGVIRLVVRLGGRLSSCSVWWNRRRRLSSMLYSVHIH